MTVSLRGTLVIHMGLFQFEFERRKCPSASAEAGVRRECPVKEKKKKKNSKKKVRRRMEIRRQQPRGGKFQRASIMF